MTIARTGVGLLLGTAAIACATAEDGTLEERARITTDVSHADNGHCVATQCIDVVATERLAYLALEGVDCDGGQITALDLERLDAAGDFVPLKMPPMWGTSDESCIGKAEKMWHYHGLERGTYRLCASFHETATPGPFAIYARAEGSACVVQSSVGMCTHCDDDPRRPAGGGMTGTGGVGIGGTPGAGGAGMGGTPGAGGKGGAPGGGDDECDDD